MQRILQYQADRILMALHEQGIGGVHVVDTVAGPRLVRFALALPHGVRPKVVLRMDDAISNRLRCTVRIVQESDGQVYVELQRDEPSTVSLVRMIRQLDPPPMSAVLGIAVDGVPVTLRLPSPDVAHVMIVGTTGSGKTVLARTMVLSMAVANMPTDLQFLLIDPKGTKFRDLNRLPHLLSDVIVEAAHGIHVLSELETVVVERDREGISSPRVVAVVDELADLVMQDGGILQPIARIAQRGREAGVHLIVCTQKPTVDVLGPLAKANFPVRIVGSVTTPEEAKIASGIKETKAHELYSRGDFLLVQQGRVVERIQAAYASASAARELIELVRARLPEQMRVSTRQNRWEPPDLQVVVDNRGLEADVRRVLRTPKFIEEYWDLETQRFKGPYQKVIGDLVNRENAGAGHYHIVKIADRLREMLISSTTTGEGRAIPENSENAGGGE